MILAPFFVQYFFTEETLSKGDLYEQLGLRWSGVVPAIFSPLFLTATLFLGPLTMQFLSGIWKLYAGTTLFIYYKNILAISTLKMKCRLFKLVL